MYLYTLPTCDFTLVDSNTNSIFCFFSATTKTIRKAKPVGTIEVKERYCYSCEHYYYRTREKSIVEKTLKAQYPNRKKDYRKEIFVTRENGTTYKRNIYDAAAFKEELNSRLNRENRDCTGSIYLFRDNECQQGYTSADIDGVEELQVNIPDYLFAKIDGDYYIALVRQLESGEIELYRFFLGNVYDNGRVCFGRYYPDLYNIKAAHNMFWEMVFNKDLSNRSRYERTDNQINLTYFTKISAYYQDRWDSLEGKPSVKVYKDVPYLIQENLNTEIIEKPEELKLEKYKGRWFYFSDIYDRYEMINYVEDTNVNCIFGEYLFKKELGIDVNITMINYDGYFIIDGNKTNIETIYGLRKLINKYKLEQAKEVNV